MAFKESEQICCTGLLSRASGSQPVGSTQREVRGGDGEGGAGRRGCEEVEDPQHPSPGCTTFTCSTSPGSVSVAANVWLHGAEFGH